MKFLRDSRYAPHQGAGSSSSPAPSSEDPSSNSRPSSAEVTRKAGDDAAMQGNSSGAHSGQEHEGGSPPAAEPKNSRFPGLRRLGSKLSRRKSVSPSIPFFTRSNNSSRFHAMDHNESHNVNASINSVPEETEYPRELHPTHNDREQGPNRHESMTVGFNGLQTQVLPGSFVSSENGGGSLSSSFMPPRSTGEERDSEGFTLRPKTVDPITKAQQEAHELNANHTGNNLTIRPEKINEIDETAEREAVMGMAEVLRNQARESKVLRAGSTRGRRDVRSTIFVPDSSQPSIPQSPIARIASFSSNSVGTPGAVPQQTPSAPSSLNRSQSVQPPARSEPPMLSKPFPIPEDTLAPPTIPRSSLGIAHDDMTAASDTTSMYSSQAARGGPKYILHPQMTDPGLNASIVETVAAEFSGTSITRSVVSGELALAYNPIEGSPSQSERVRLDNFDVLEKIASNPSFVTENPSTDAERKGEYTVSLPSISRPLPMVAFKYQVHLNPSNMSSYCPVFFRPMWKLRDKEASVIINYAINPAFISLSNSRSLVLHNLVLRVKLDSKRQDDAESANATSASMYPDTGAYFRRKHSCAMWKIPSFEISTEGQNRFLARFNTDLPGPRPGKTEVKFDITADDGKRLGVKSIPGTVKPEKDPFADGDDKNESSDPGWKDVPTRRNLRMATYLANDN